MADYTLRNCAPGDETWLALVGAASFLEAFAGFLEGEDILLHCQKQHSEEKYAAMLADPGTFACVAEMKGAPVGYALLCTPDLPIPVTPNDIELKRIYLLHRFQGTGIGAALMQWSVDMAKELGKHRLLLGVNAQNDRAIAFYRRNDFEQAGTRQFLVGRTLNHDLIFSHNLSI